MVWNQLPLCNEIILTWKNCGGGQWQMSVLHFFIPKRTVMEVETQHTPFFLINIVTPTWIWSLVHRLHSVFTPFPSAAHITEGGILLSLPTQKRGWISPIKTAVCLRAIWHQRGRLNHWLVCSCCFALSSVRCICDACSPRLLCVDWDWRPGVLLHLNFASNYRSAPCVLFMIWHSKSRFILNMIVTSKKAIVLNHIFYTASTSVRCLKLINSR